MPYYGYGSRYVKNPNLPWTVTDDPMDDKFLVVMIGGVIGLLGGVGGMLFALILDAAFVSGSGVNGAAEAGDALYGAVSGGGVMLAIAGYLWNQVIGPKRYPPLEFPSSEHKDVYKAWNAMSAEDQDLFRNAYKAINNADPGTRAFNEACEIWDTIERRVRDRDRLLATQHKDPYLEEANYDLANLNEQIQGLENTQ